MRRLQPEAVGRPDWHNDFAQLTIDLRAALESASDERSRGILLRQLRRALDPES
jgi:metallo-beta-lactamase family protein